MFGFPCVGIMESWMHFAVVDVILIRGVDSGSTVEVKSLFRLHKMVEVGYQKRICMVRCRRCCWSL